MNEVEFERFKTYLLFGNPDGCWESVKKHDSRGYARFWWRGQWRQGHRIAYQFVSEDLTLLEIPRIIPEEGTNQVDHKCNNRQCWNPAHLQLCTMKQNHEWRAIRYFERKRLREAEELI